VTERVADAASAKDMMSLVVIYFRWIVRMGRAGDVDDDLDESRMPSDLALRVTVAGHSASAYWVRVTACAAVRSEIGSRG